jgi:4-amino-4-deoxy-L-arabinose transferase-like glycosyltransferase
MAAPRTRRPRAREPRTALPAYVAGVLAVMIVVRLLFLGEAAGRDEAGFLLVGAGWDHGTSLYGSYWVDRPPLLIWIMQLAGSLTGLRLIGLGASVLMVLGVGRTAQLAAGDRAARWAVGAAALFSTAHWFGVPRTNGEMLAGAFVAWGFALAAEALLRPSRRSIWFAAAAGALGAAAMLVKQTIVDGLVFAVVLAVLVGWDTRRRSNAVRVLVAGAAGFAVAVGIGLAAAQARGTSPSELFDALVTFRADAGEVIRTSASAATTDRLLVLLATWAVSGLAIVAVLTTGHALRRRDPVLRATWAVIVVVSAAAMLGGSYWSHYLLQLVPATALAVGLLAERVRPRLLRALTVFVVAVTAGNLVWSLATPTRDGVEAQEMGRWLKASGIAGDTAVIAYGQPNVLAAAHMSSPYPYLWSLPVRTLDPDLAELSTVMAGPSRPVWFVDWSGIDSWGIDPTTMRAVLAKRYRVVAEVCGRTVWLDRSHPRSLAPLRSCS